ncbi:MAG: glycosyltransferase family 4 protein [Verrucomicrobiales bacterium]|nr:glycosyltransferase family 4 protein [Verrucomicrobiales bacterium]
MKVAIVSNHGPTLVRFRGDLLRRLVAEGHEVITYVPPVGQELVDEILKLGVTFYPYPLDRTSTNPFRDWKSYSALKRRLALDQPEIVFCYTAKPMIYGSFAAARTTEARIVSLVTGLGYGFSGGDIKQRLLSRLQRFLYRRAFKNNARVVFQNPDDCQLFLDWKLVTDEQKAVVAGSGVNVAEFEYTELPEQKEITFVMVARLLREKGVYEYLEAARRVREKFPESGCRFLLVGGEDGNPGGVKLARLREMGSPVEILGHQDDVKSFLINSHCFVLPSYREGTPRSTLEALAIGRPVITTDAAGCRETVVHGENGWVIKVANADALTNAMSEAVTMSRDDLLRFSRASRKRAEEVFDVNKVNEMMVSLILGNENEPS